MPHSISNFINSRIAHIAKVIAAVSLLVFVTVGCNRRSGSGLNPGEFAPEIELTSLDGAKFSLASLKGKVVVVNFWTTWCQPCVDELPSLERLREKLGPLGFEVVGVAVQDADQKLRDLVKKLNLTFPVVSDRGTAVQRAYKVQAFPESFILDREGRIVFAYDPEMREPVAKVVGSREWDGLEMVEVLRKLLDAKGEGKPTP